MASYWWIRSPAKNNVFKWLRAERKGSHFYWGLMCAIASQHISRSFPTASIDPLSFSHHSHLSPSSFLTTLFFSVEIVLYTWDTPFSRPKRYLIQYYLPYYEQILKLGYYSGTALIFRRVPNTEKNPLRNPSDLAVFLHLHLSLDNYVIVL